MDITVDALRNIQPDPVLSGFAMATPQKGLVADLLFKRGTPTASTVKLLDFGKQGLKPLLGTLVTDQTSKIATFGLDAPTGESYTVEPHAMRAPVNAFAAQKALEAVTGAINLLKRKSDTLRSQWNTTKEVFAINLMASSAVFDASFSNVTSLASAKWNTTSGKPVDDVMAAKEGISLRAGVIPNKMLVTYSTLNVLRRNSQILGLNPSTQAGVTTKEQLTAYLELDEIIVASGLVNSGKRKQADSLAWAWPSAEAILFYEAPILNEETRTFALNLPWNGWEDVQAWMEEDNRLVNHLYQVECLRFVVADKLCAQKFTNVI